MTEIIQQGVVAAAVWGLLTVIATIIRSRTSIRIEQVKAENNHRIVETQTEAARIDSLWRMVNGLQETIREQDEKIDAQRLEIEQCQRDRHELSRRLDKLEAKEPPHARPEQPSD